MTEPAPNTDALHHYAQEAASLTLDLPSSLLQYGQRASSLLQEDICIRNQALSTYFAPKPGLMDAADLDFPSEAHRRVIAWMLDPARSGKIAPALWRLWTNHQNWSGKLRVGRQDLFGLDVLAWDAGRKQGLALVMTHAEETTHTLSATLDASARKTLLALKAQPDALVWLYVTPSGSPPHSAWGTRHLWRNLSWGGWRQHLGVLAQDVTLEAEERAFLRRYQHLLTRHVLTNPHTYQLARKAWVDLQDNIGQLEKLSKTQLTLLHHELCTLGRIFHTGPR